MVCWQCAEVVTGMHSVALGGGRRPVGRCSKYRKGRVTRYVVWLRQEENPTFYNL